VAPGSGPPDAAEVTTDESGRFTIAEVPRGEYVLVVRPGARAEPYSRLARETRKAIEVTEDGWLGEVRYLVLPSGEVALSFAIPDSSGGTTPANGTVRVTVTSFRPAGEHAEATAGAPTHGAAQLVQDARDGFHDRWREGEYRVRCAITIEGKQIVKEEAFTIAAGGRVERTVRFVGGR